MSQTSLNHFCFAGQLTLHFCCCFSQPNQNICKFITGNWAKSGPLWLQSKAPGQLWYSFSQTVFSRRCDFSLQHQQLAFFSGPFSTKKQSLWSRGLSCPACNKEGQRLTNAQWYGAIGLGWAEQGGPHSWWVTGQPPQPATHAQLVTKACLFCDTSQ